MSALGTGPRDGAAARPGATAQPATPPLRSDDTVALDRGGLRRPAGGDGLDDSARRWALTLVFLGDLTRSLGRKFWFALAFLPSLGFIAWILLRTRVEQLALPPAQLSDFVLEQIGRSLGVGALWAAMSAALIGAAGLPRDLQAGALLLYFTRPLERIDYLLSRWLALWIWLAAGVALPSLLVLFGAALELGWQLPGRDGFGTAWFWLGGVAALATTAAVAGAALAAVALGAGALLRNATAAAVAMIGAGLGSSAAANLAVLLWERDSLAGALDLPRGLTAAWILCSRPLSDAAPVPVATLEAAAALGLWLALGIGGWFAAARLLARAPLGRGRT